LCSSSVLGRPIEKIISRNPDIIIVLLKKSEEDSNIPRSLIAFSVQLKLGAICIDKKRLINAKNGSINPQKPDIFSSFILNFTKFYIS
jgi:hypothetical protein